MIKFRNVLALVAILAAINASCAAEQSIVLASTTSVEASGLLTNILPQFTAKTGITVNVVAQGTGKALDTARRGDADVVLVHDPEAEREFVDHTSADRLERLYYRWSIERPGSHIGRQRRRHGLEGNCRFASAVRFAWRQERHERR
jgi:ABC-type tungstate transport system permease subunit